MSLWTAALLAQVITLSGGDRTELRTRVQAGADPSFDAETRATAQLAERDHRSGWNLQYAPALTILFLGSPYQTTALIQNGHADFYYRWPRTTVLLNQDAMYGRQNVYTVALVPAASTNSNSNSTTTTTTPGQEMPSAPTSPVGQLVPHTQQRFAVLQTGASYSSIAIQHTFSRRVSATASSLYAVTGGLDQPSRQYLPLIYGPAATAGLVYRLTLADDLITSASGTLTESSLHIQSRIATGEERWEHRFSPVLSGRLSGGVAGGDRLGIVPVASAGLTLMDGVDRNRLSLTVSATMRPVIDPRTARADNRIGGRADCRWTDGPWSITGALASTQSLKWGEAESIAAYTGTIGTAYGFTREWTGETGLGATKVFFAGLEQSMIWSFFIALRYQAIFATF